MRIKMAKKGMQVVDKISGKTFEIVATNGRNEDLPTEATAVEVLPEESEAEPESVVITWENDITFRVTKWVDDETIYDASVKDGTLVINNEPVEMGNIEVHVIIGALPGVVIFAAKNTDGLELMSYSPSRDRFRKLLNGFQYPGDGTILEASETRMIICYSSTKEVDEKNEEGEKETKTVFDQAGVIVVTAKGATVSESGEYLDLSKAVLSVDGKYLYIPSGLPEERENEYYYATYRVTGRVDYEGTIELPEGLGDVTKNRFNSDIGPAVFIGADFIQVGYRENLLTGKAISDFPKGAWYLVDYFANGDTTVFTLANNDREVRRIIRKVTSDRGSLITVE